MDKLVVVFSTKEEADVLQERDYQHFISLSNDINYERTTTAWATPRQRTDGKWAYPCLDGADYTGYTVELYNETNYYTSE